MSDKLTREDLLLLLIEECGEVIQAATKCLRFGWDREFPTYGHNGDVLSEEIGQLSAVVSELSPSLSVSARAKGFQDKIAQATHAKRMWGQEQ